MPEGKQDRDNDACNKTKQGVVTWCGHKGNVIKVQNNNTQNYCSTLQTYTNGDEVDGLVDAAERGDINSLATHDTGSTNAGRVLARASGDDGLDEHLDGVLIREQVDDLKGVLNDAHSHQLLAVVAAVEHHRVHQALNNGALYIVWREGNDKEW